MLSKKRQSHKEACLHFTKFVHNNYRWITDLLRNCYKNIHSFQNAKLIEIKEIKKQEKIFPVF